MPYPENRSHFRRALRTSWRILKLTLAPPGHPGGAAEETEFPPPEDARESPSAPPMADAPSPPGASTPPADEARQVGPSVTAGPTPAGSGQVLASVPSGSASAEMLSLVQARLDLFSERLDLLRDQVHAANFAANANNGRSARTLPRPGSLHRELGLLSERLERLERRNAPAEELPSRAALRPPRVPLGLDLFETTSGPAAASTEWDFVDGAVMGPRLNGTFQELRLATLLEVLQLERRVGVLVLRTPDHTLEVDLRRGTVTGVRLDGADADVVAALREAFRWTNAEFGFRKSDVVRESGAPRSIHGLMLEVLRQHDEAARAG